MLFGIQKKKYEQHEIATAPFIQYPYIVNVIALVSFDFDALAWDNGRAQW